MTINDKISAAIKDQLEVKGYDLVSVNAVFGSRAAVDIFIDRFDGRPVSIDDCVTVSQLASAILDVEDIIQGKYNLNISSPGETRLLRNERDFERFCGGEISVELEKPAENGRKKVRGTLVKIENSVVYLKLKTQKKGKQHAQNKSAEKEEQKENFSEEIKINFIDIKRANLHRVFEI